MNVVTRRPLQKAHDDVVTTIGDSHLVSLYTDVPSYGMDLDEFESVALKRLKVLRLVEKVGADSRMEYDDKREKVRNILKQEGLTRNKRDDESSHFILRLAYCASEEHRRWFLQQETALLGYRLANSDSLLKAVSLKYSQSKVSKEDMSDVQNELEMIFSLKELRGDIYAAPFENVLGLIENRLCFVKAGVAYISNDQLVKLILQQFRTDLSRELMFLDTNARLEAGKKNEQISPLLKKVHSVFSTDSSSEADMTASGITVNAVTVPQLKAHMPLCMRTLQTGLERDGKLKHWGRLQYGLFLKGTGLSLDDALIFFQRAFSPTTMPDKFQKQYAYSIRHQYGKEGKRATYTPYSCSKIIQGNAPNSGEHHGCPYKHHDANHLALLLRQLKVGANEADRQAIVSKARDGHAQLACLEHFNLTHEHAASKSGVNVDNVGNHPNAWFRASVQYHKSVNNISDSNDKNDAMGES